MISHYFAFYCEYFVLFAEGYENASYSRHFIFPRYICRLDSIIGHESGEQKWTKSYREKNVVGKKQNSKENKKCGIHSCME